VVGDLRASQVSEGIAASCQVAFTLGASQKATADIDRQKLEKRYSQLQRRGCRSDS
jgi:hypothetical protein